MPLCAQPLHDTDVHTHLGEGPHKPGSGSDYLLLRQPSGVFERLLYILALKVGIALKDVLNTRPVGNLSDNQGNRDTHPSDTGPPAHDCGVERGAIETAHSPTPLSPYSLSDPYLRSRHGPNSEVNTT